MTPDEEDDITDAATGTVWNWFWAVQKKLDPSRPQDRKALTDEYAKRWQVAIRAGATAERAARAREAAK